MIKSILVLESPWDTESLRSMSVWPFVSEFCQIVGIEPLFRTFHDSASLSHWVDVYHNEHQASSKLLYIAAHGHRSRLSALTAVNHSTVADILKRAKSVEYVHFGSCSFGNEESLRRLMKNARHVRWIAGYGTADISWVESTLFDILFWHRVLVRDDDHKYKHQTTMMTELFQNNPLAKDMGFTVCYRRGRTVCTLNSTNCVVDDRERSAA
ncbi:MAG TPA: hypothetical protein DFS52_13000 [Myxococcales bacterium]|jgi:hypothetical protein|nr:hypothetical protein [Myxococcales bacterium]